MEIRNDSFDFALNILCIKCKDFRVLSFTYSYVTCAGLHRVYWLVMVLIVDVDSTVKICPSFLFASK